MTETAQSTSPKKHDRPLSPHLQVYRLPMTALMSITHRMTGVALSAGCALIAAFLVAAAVSEEAFEWVRDFSITPFGTLILFAWSLALYYHLYNGIRHLIWDTVHLLDERKAVISGWIVLLATAATTAATWYFASIY